MNILIVGFGTAGKYYFNLLKKFSKINKIFVSDIKKIKKSHEYKIINFEISEINKSRISLTKLFLREFISIKYNIL